MNNQTNLNFPKSQHLILLVGSNPLPNAVAAKLLLAEGGTVTLIHSKGTLETFLS
jgi:hypothetical protein